ncbi:MAG: UDP-N-acetylmuramate dehydrogenase [Actinomycetota bacterium]
MALDPASIPGVQADVALAPLTTYKLGGPASWFVEVLSEPALRSVLGATPSDMEILLLGRGSNLLISDTGFDGVVIRLGGSFLAVDVDEDGIVTAGGGAALPRVARLSAVAGRCGLEFFAGIPGSIGGAVRMNAGGHGSDTAAHLITARIVNRRTGASVERTAEQLDLRYRHSNLGSDDIVAAAILRTDPCSVEESEQRIREITRWRKDHQPGGTFNAGSVFKNPPDDSAGRLIDAIGLKGLRRGAVSVSEMHANFFVADDHATAQDVWDLVWAVRRRVGEEAGVWLVPEIRFAGRFEPTGDEAMGPRATT